MPAPLHITLIQPNIIWEDKAANMQQYEGYFKQLPHQRHIVLLPEMCTTGFSMEPEKLAETMDGASVQWLRDMARMYRCIIAGSFIIEEEGKYYNRLIWMQPNGQHYQYDKRHLFGYAGEHEHYTAGEQRLIVQVNGWRICPMVCYDLRFPVWGRNGFSHAGDRQHQSPHLSPPPVGEEAKIQSAHPDLLPIGEGTRGQVEELKDGNFYRSANPRIYEKLKMFVASHRAKPTKAEEVFWGYLRNSQLEGYSFRRQHIIGNYIADFVCLSVRLIIEVDGLIHQLPENVESDQLRTDWLNSQGFTVIRFTNEDVLYQMQATLEKIKIVLQKSSNNNIANSQSGPFPYGGKVRMGATDDKESESALLGYANKSNPASSYDLLLYLANWPQRRSLAWKTLLQARAIENQCYTIGLNRVGKDGKDIEYSGDSSVFGPLGETLWQQSGDAVMHTITLDKESLNSTRQQFPFLQDADPFVLL